jgi:hypothetical protein
MTTDTLTYRITGTTRNGTEDSIVISADTIEELQVIAKREVQSRGWTDCWSEELY